ncbi:MAG: hypothetical protein J0M26_18930, partial [Planctomycetes bacterium]|nr:hypothetical protein [Planctomycetota bacterium]
MAYEPGGYADKLGNRYEGRWVVQQMLLLLNERLSSIQIDAVGSDQKGVDLWVTHLDKTRVAQQCKGENGNKANWSIRDLCSREVLAYLKQQLLGYPTHRFTFVSSTPANELRDISRSAQDSTGESQSFYDNQIAVGSKPRRQAFSAFCSCLRLDEKRPSDREIAFDLLRRSDFHLFSDDREQKEQLKCMANLLVAGDSGSVIALLADYAQDHLRRPIYAKDLRDYLEASKCPPRRLLADGRVTPRLKELQEEFVESIQQHLAGGTFIPRAEVEELHNAVFDEEPVDAIVLHGLAGHGKSGVLLDLCKRLSNLDVPFLAVRLDRKQPTETPRSFGKSLDLPDSPVISLCIASDDRPCVLILDQLDALRWTSAHAAQGIDMCKGILREVRAMRQLGHKISLVLSCRTYDLENDPELKSWLKESDSRNFKKIKVDALPEAAIEEFIGKLNLGYSQLTVRRKKLLKCVQNLALWIDVMQTEDRSPEFDSVTDLFRDYWTNRRRLLEARGIPHSESQQVLDSIVEYMERNACLYAPRYLIDGHEKLATELQTLNILNLQRRIVSFGHQSQADFLIALKAKQRMDGRGDRFLGWLGGMEQQSLFRREQLRHLIFLLADDQNPDLARDLEMLTSSREVRFHIKQVVVEAVGQIHPRGDLQGFVFGLLDHADWRTHVVRFVFHRNERWIEALHDSGRLCQMILSDEPWQYSTATWLLISIANRLPHIVDDILAEVIKAGVEERLLDYLRHSDVKSETDSVFQFRLSMTKRDEEPPCIDWVKVSESRPRRAIALLAKFLGDYQGNLAQTRVGRRLDMDRKNDYRAIQVAAARCPKFAVRRLGPILYRVAKCSVREWEAWNGRNGTRRNVRSPTTRLPKILLKTLRSAVGSLAQHDPESFFELNRRLESISSRSVQSLLVYGWAALPQQVFADKAVLWLLSDGRRLRCGSALRKPRWSEAARLIEKMSPWCSAPVFEQLESILLGYRDPDERTQALYWLNATRSGYYLNGFGAAKHYLLPALDPHRRSAKTISLIGVLREKFANYPSDRFLRPNSRGGTVRSPLGPQAIQKMSDKQWLRLIQNQGIPSRNLRERRWRHINQFFLESSVEMFASDFGIAAMREPERFGKLALKFSCNDHPEYLVKVFAALEQQGPQGGLTEEDRKTWQPASCELVEQVLEKAVLSDHNYLTRQFCWLLLKRSDVAATEKIILRLIELASQPDPDYDLPERMVPEEAARPTANHFANVAANHVRALAVSTMGAIVYRQNLLLDRLRAPLSRAVDDPHPAVRLAIVGVCSTIWTINRNLSLDWFLRANSSDLWPACGPYAQQFMNLAFPHLKEQLMPLISSMVQSSESCISEEGAEEAFARWLFYGDCADLVETCRG